MVDPALVAQTIPGAVSGRSPDMVEIKTLDDKLYSAVIHYDDIKGYNRNPLTWEELVDKFKVNLTFAAKPLPHAEEIIDMVSHLEEVNDMSKLVALLVTAE